VLDRVFDPFFFFYDQGSRPDGTGLGLSLVDGIVHDLGGAIAVVDSAGRKVPAFTIWLPVTGEKTTRVRRSAAPSSCPMGTARTILIGRR